MSETSVVSIEAVHPGLSEFGQYLYKLMLSRGYKSFSALASAMDADQYRVHRQTVSKLAKGEQPAQPRFARRLTIVLGLSEEEEQELAWTLYRFG